MNIFLHKWVIRSYLPNLNYQLPNYHPDTGGFNKRDY